ncbi:MAG: hypothetical protein R6V01_03900 [Thermoplasmatota archaeon]
MRYAVKVAYDGSLFSGLQRQGGEHRGSVEGSIIKALVEIGENEEEGPCPIRFSSRTDSGVSALGNVFTLDSDMEPDELLKAMNSKLEGIWCWGYGEPRPSQNIRWANSRWYRYHLPPGSLVEDQIDELRTVLGLFEGSHDFTTLSRLEKGKNPVTFVERTDVIDLSGNAQLVALDIVGSRFLWQQVRRMVGAAMGKVSGRLSEDDIRKLLAGEGKDISYRNMPPTGLVLMDVHFKDIDFRVSRKALERALRRCSTSAWQASMRVILDSALRSLMG